MPSNFVEVPFGRSLLVFTVGEFNKMLAGNGEIWDTAIKRGKGWKRADQAEKRVLKPGRAAGYEGGNTYAR